MQTEVLNTSTMEREKSDREEFFASECVRNLLSSVKLFQKISRGE
jgi:hypothetical protein